MNYSQHSNNKNSLGEKLTQVIQLLREIDCDGQGTGQAGDRRFGGGRAPLRPLYDQAEQGRDRGSRYQKSLAIHA